MNRSPRKYQANTGEPKHRPLAQQPNDQHTEDKKRKQSDLQHDDV